MRLVTFDDGRVGEVRDDRVLELGAHSMLEYFEGGAVAGPTGREHALEEVRLRAPIVPRKFFHTAGNFREHEEESKNVGWSHEIAPWIVFFQNVDAIVGPDEPVLYPEHLTEELDYELELAVILRKPGRWFSPEEAADYIGGYVIFNDITARDIQYSEAQWSRCKSFDGFTPTGPFVVTADEVPDPQDLHIWTVLDGRTLQDASTAQMVRPVSTLISHLSRSVTLLPGTLISTGSPGGAGYSRDPQVFLRDRSTVTVGIDGIGALTTHCRIMD